MRGVFIAAALAAAPVVARAQDERTSVSPHGKLATPCAQCHRPDSWKPVKISPDFKHPEGFVLEGAHATTCTSCHKRLDFTGVSKTCTSCHRDEHKGELGANCANCHTTRSFLDMTHMRERHQATSFPLTGRHAAADCRSCHAPRAPGQQAFVNLPTTCSTCHMKEYNAARTPPHLAGGFPRDCAACHSSDSWRGAPFDHNATQFPLTGAHRAATCQGCHADNVYKGKPTTCASCHQQQFASTTNPPHAAAGFALTCQTCHNTTAWSGAPFDHDRTQFPLTGAHKASTCADCHRDGVYRGKPTTCVSCHQSAYDRTTKPAHKPAGFSTTCQTCHTTTAWLGAVFDHNATRFPLAGAHRAVDCSSCHADGVYSGKPTTCVSCHQTAFNATKNPPHAAAAFPTSCETCHSQTAWVPSSFNHAATQFPLTGAHLTTTCAGCHADGVYNGKPTDCVSCHQAKYNATTNPPHAAAGFSTACQTCHTTTQWPGAVFDHGATRFPLVGAHRAVNCADCHADGVYRGKPTTCVSCHQAKYAATTNPAHAAAAFPTTCETCHSQTAWTPASFNHAATLFPLTGAHLTTTCSKCHGDGVYKGKPTTCVSCHLAKYTATTNPNHTAAGFPTDCAACHTTTQWLGATFDHDGKYFPIYSGAHAGKWSTCATCHTSPTSFAVFTCTNCHLKAKTDEQHQGRAGYVYASQSCYGCHPRGKSG
jgi:hypothetical protein